MFTNIFFAFNDHIPRNVLTELKQIGADIQTPTYDASLEEEFCCLQINSKPNLIKVMHYLRNLNDYHFKYYYPLRQEVLN